MSEENKEEQKQEIKTIKCKNCLKEIDETKFFLHEGFCLRNNVLCTICKEPVTKDDLEAHMEEHKKDHTVLFITHDPTLMRKADRILVVDDGVIVAQGTHKALIKRSKFYRDLQNR